MKYPYTTPAQPLFTGDLADLLRRYRLELPRATAHVQAQTDEVIEVIVDPEANAADALATALPAVIAALSPIIDARRVTLATATTAITAISAVVAQVAPKLKGASARAVVLALFGWAWDTYLARLLPLWLKPFSGLIKGAAVNALQLAYDSAVKRLKKS